MMKLITYHGSINAFDTFSYNHIRTNGTEYGVGFYTTTAESYARQFTRKRGFEAGYLYTYEFDPQKALSLTDRYITDDELAELLLALHDKIDCLWNYEDIDYYGIDVALTKAIEIESLDSDNDVDLINGIVNSSGDIQAVLETLYEVLGYTHIEVFDRESCGDFYIALVPDCLKLLKREQV